MCAPDARQEWLLAVGAGSAPLRGGVEPDVRHEGRRLALRLWHGDEPPQVVWRDGVALVLAGRLERGDAAQLLAGYLAAGARPWQTLRGPFAIVLWDGRDDTVEAVRDHFGVQPAFYAERDGELVLSPSPDAIARCGLVPAAPNPTAVARWVLDGCAALPETLHEGVSRLPPAHRLQWRGGGATAARYWQPHVAGEAPAAVGETVAAERFAQALDRAVARCVRGRPAGVLLSGGVDSAAVACSLRATGATPVALSLVFPDAESNEEPAQRALAAALGVLQELVPLARALDGRPLLAAGLEHTRRSWQPCINPWEPAYAHLARLGAEHGCEVVVGGSGGNELLELPWAWSADLLRRGDVRGLARFAGALARYSGGAPRHYAAELAWSAGARPLLRDAVLLPLPPGVVRPLRAARYERALPAWALPDRALRARVVAEHAPPAAAGLAAARRRDLDSPYDAVFTEAWHVVSRATGVELRSPLFDPDVAELVLALPPRAVMLGGQVKGLARERVRRSLGDAAAAPLAAVGADLLFERALRSEAPAALSALGGLPTLATLGIVDAGRALAAFARLDSYARWQLLATEAWLQDRFA